MLAGKRYAADGPLLLHVPVLVEADHRDDDQQQLDGDEDDAEQAEEVIGKGRPAETRLVAVEPCGGGNGGEDREDDR